MKPYVIFLDIDGTVMHRGIVSQEDRQAIAKAQRAGHQVWINTGRAHFYVPELLTKEVGVDGVIAGLGADIRRKGVQLYSKTLPFSVLDWVAERLEGICFLFEGEDGMYQQGDRFRGKYVKIRPGIPFSEQYPDAKISKMCVFDEPPEDVIRELEQHFRYFQYPTYHELEPVGQSKATGMEWVMNYLQLPMEQSIAVGDSANDLAMLKAAGISVAMGNAPAEVQALCDYVTSPVTESGVAKAIEHFLF